MATDEHRIVVFLGPTLPPREAVARLDATYLPPVALGDVMRVLEWRPRVIGIIDGYFEHRPAVWHKEILTALDSGVHVVGASSIGALRAAELDAFGMTGVGTIFESYRDGRLIADDEVAVAHAQSDDDFRQSSEALVNIRATLDAARESGLVSVETNQLLIAVAQSLFYPDRVWPTILERARADGVDASQLKRLTAWLPDNSVDVKKQDALDLLDRVAMLAADPFEPKKVSFHLEETSNWLQVATHIDPTAPPNHVPHLEPVLDELRLDPALYRSTRDRALIRWLATRLAEGHDVRPSVATMQEHIESYRRDHGLLTEEQSAGWIATADLDEFGAESMFYGEARASWVLAVAEHWLHQTIADVLRTDGEYARLAERARRKQESLESVGLDRPVAAVLGTDDTSVIDWFWRNHGDGESRDAGDLVDELGFEDEIVGLTALLREFAYCHAAGGPEEDERRLSSGRGPDERDDGEGVPVTGTGSRPAS
jgi:hypothetical protein